VILLAGVEAQRSNETDPVKKLYPGGSFDPMGFAKDPKKVDDLKLKEIKNARLAMVAFMGFVGQNYATGKGPIAALTSHVSDPAGANFATNGVSFPFFN
jgi:light-harvesting complex I chlorophyll a/b binding protein 1